MPWELTIKHIRLGTIGDSTLIVATDGTTTRSVLIDGGLDNDAARVDGQLVAAGVTKLDVMVATHYDKDHYYGLVALLQMADPDDGEAFDAKYQGVRIYDQGESGTVAATTKRVAVEEEADEDDEDDEDDDAEGGDAAEDGEDDAEDGEAAEGDGKKKRKRGDGDDEDEDEDEGQGARKVRRVTVAKTPTGREDKFTTYLAAVKARKAVRVTRNVISKHSVPKGLDDYHEPYALVDREIMWDDKNEIGAKPDPNRIPKDAPTLTCIAANQYTKRGNGDVVLCPGAAEGNPESQANARSLAFLLKFGRFRYYVGGDLETKQEDTLIDYLKASGPNSMKLDAFKTSHHGSVHSTSEKFVKQLDPRVAIISCGDENQYNHPEQDVINWLEKYNVYYFATGERLKPTCKGKPSTVMGRNVSWPHQANIAGTKNDKNATITLTITQADAAKTKPTFKVTLLRPNAGANLERKADYKYEPSANWTTTFN